MISSCWLGLVTLLVKLIHGNQAVVTLTLYVLPYQEEAVAKEMVIALVMTVLLNPDPL